jgi:transposase
MIGHYDVLIESLEKHILKAAKGWYPKELAILQTIPGVGPIIALTILFEIDSIDRFATRQQFASYCRLVKPRHESAGKQYGTVGSKMGNPYLKWAFSEACVHAARINPRIDKCLRRVESKYGPAKARSRLAHKIGRSVYHMLEKKKVFDEEKFVRA